ncbi:MAG: FeoA domain-containing protein [Thermotogaceae bacterium]|nr:FeoA domain-containing protein [Thermotogaceae bacterium]
MKKKREKNHEWMRLLMEDIMRLSREKDSPLSVEDVMEDSSVDRQEVKEAIERLEKRGLAKFERGHLALTEQGEKVADVIYNYHRVIEEVLGHEVAHALEHFSEAAEKIKILGEKAKPLEKFRENERGVVAYFEIGNPKVISKLLGIGLSPGVSFRVIKYRKDGFVLEVGGRLVVLGRELGKGIAGVSMS